MVARITYPDQGSLLMMFDYKDGLLFWKEGVPNKVKTRSVAMTFTNGYMGIRFDGHAFLLHRLIFLYHHGYLPAFVDHINADKRDNRIENLRACTHSQNHAARRSSNTTHRGVYQSNGKWRARIKVRGIYKHLGSFMSRSEAAEAYNSAALQHFGEFAILNEV